MGRGKKKRVIDRKEKPLIGITMGDPTGVGPEVIVKCLADKTIRETCNVVVFGDKGVMQKAVQDLGYNLYVQEVTNLEYFKIADNVIPVKNLSNLRATKLKPGRPDRNCGRAMVTYVKEASQAAMQNLIDAIVTAPINKEIINEAGFRWNGHTEMIADFTKSKDSVMMLASPHFKVSLVTIHMPLKDVPMRITPKKIYKVGLITWQYLREYFGIKNPRIGVCGLNPHASEGGIFGDEEKELIYPAVVSLQIIGIDAQGPIPSDVIFRQAYEGKLDAVIAMYHDQAFIPVKLIDFKEGVNITLGLNVIRTSPIHGTAYDIAGKNLADPSSMRRAILMAAEMVKIRRQTQKQKEEEMSEKERKIYEAIRKRDEEIEVFGIKM